jgi:hypothetical protein
MESCALRNLEQITAALYPLLPDLQFGICTFMLRPRVPWHYFALCPYCVIPNRWSTSEEAVSFLCNFYGRFPLPFVTKRYLKSLWSDKHSYTVVGYVFLRISSTIPIILVVLHILQPIRAYTDMFTVTYTSVVSTIHKSSCHLMLRIKFRW